MPLKPMRPCPHPGCGNLTRGKYCEDHKSQHTWAHNKEVRRLRGRKLQRERERLFNEQPLCVECLKVGRDTPATQRDHIVPLAEGGEDARDNTQAICQACHDAKTKQESKRGKYNKNNSIK
jgi:5-methylcytosine-specific restriction protein A